MTTKRRNTKNKGKLSKKIGGTRKKTGGIKRVEKVYIEFSRDHTGPNIKSKVSVIKGPRSYKSNGNVGYLMNFVSSSADEFEAELAKIMMGIPNTIGKRKKYELIFYDKD
jgi:hypothetical protein